MGMILSQSNRTVLSNRVQPLIMKYLEKTTSIFRPILPIQTTDCLKARLG